METMPTRMADAMGRASQRMIYGDLTKYGLPLPGMGVKSSVEQRFVAPAIDAGFVDAVKQGRIELVTTIDRFEGAEVVLSDGTRLRPDSVLCATGYRRGLEPLVGHLGVLDEQGCPKSRPAVEVAEAPNLAIRRLHAPRRGIAARRSGSTPGARRGSPASAGHQVARPTRSPVRRLRARS